MTDTSARHDLPFLIPGQAQKEFFHNEALARIDMILCAAVENAGVAVPPTDPAPGQAWIVTSGAAGAFEGRANQIACWTESGWRFAQVVAGMQVWNKADGYFMIWAGAGWDAGVVHGSSVNIEGKQIIGERLPAIAAPAGGSVVDAEARAAIAALTAALKTHGLTD
ncbi:DUF2793 domain-containing protein [Allosphingosinicella vermicomposti]|uniref:DUF2793 domain-containing protein n=1 Tax=Allosphingosinicella vermicomposti TaxID=614671 RepID=UPI0018F892B8|nr:DUF2793 domain-containing protein [Allosphingosinicella vermicomposti]